MEQIILLHFTFMSDWLYLSIGIQKYMSTLLAEFLIFL